VLARREGKAERHIRLLLPLAFLSPRIVSALLDGTAPADLTITALARGLPWSWAEQERRLGLPCDQSAHPPNRYSASLLNGECMR
jgi:site-specific DNA recombinase